MTWIIQENLTGISIKEETKSRTRQDSLVCTINKHGYLKDKCHANARLIAAAPELLDALLLCECELSQNHGLAWPNRNAFLDAVNAARAAIKKTKGTI